MFSRTSWPMSIKLGTNHTWVKGILNSSKRDQVLFKWEIIIYRNAEIVWGPLKIFFSLTIEPE
jgi:hypothetical protein